LKRYFTSIIFFGNLIPIIGIIQFFIFYYIATLYYPGGSQVDGNAIGFSWYNNYWCNLLSDTAINGKPNMAKPFAKFGMIVLSIALSFFWYNFPRQINVQNRLKFVIQFSGIAGLLVGLLLFSNLNHDLVTNAASLFGGIAILGTIIGLYKNKFSSLFRFGLFNIFLVGVNNLCYYNKELIVYLPLIQKLSFAAFLIWIGCICLKINRRRKL
jgi:hypothetical protein